MNVTALRETEPVSGASFDLSPSAKQGANAFAKIVNLKASQDYSERLSAISHFSMEIAHHLNNSLTPIICYAQLLAQGSNSPEQKKRLEKITTAAYHAKEIVDGLISFSAGQPVQVMPVDLNALIRETLEVAEGLFWLPPKQVHLEVDPQLPFIYGDPHQLSQVVLHLLKNAMQATQSKTREIHLRIQQTKDRQIVIEVEDNGVGIAPEILPKVLLPFFTTREGDGVGLGLSIVNGIVEGHGAHLEIRTEQGKGTLIRIVFNPVED